MRTLAVLLLFTLPAAAQPWRYVNKQGVATYTTNPNDLPPAQRKKVLAQLEQKRLEAEAQRAAEAAAAAEAPPTIPVVPEEEPEAAPASAPASAPDSAAPDSQAAKKPPTAREIWQTKVDKAGKELVDLAAELASAQAAAEEASRRAIVTPSGQNSARHAAAQEKLQTLQKKLQTAQEALQRLQRAEPRR